MKLAKPLLIAVVVLAIAGALAYALMDRSRAPAATFTTLDGKSIVLSQLHGKIVVVNFWATSCPGCVKEIPELAELYKQYNARGLEIIAVAMSYDPPNYVASFAKTRQVPFPVALDVNGEHARAFGNVQVTPTSFIIDKDGSIIEEKLGELDFVKLRALLDKELS
jgi:peroxiredoxin